MLGRGLRATLGRRPPPASRAVDEQPHPLLRSALLAPSVEIALAAGDVTAARLAADELAQVAADIGSPLLQARGAQANGAVLLAEGAARAAMPELRRAWTMWQGLGAPYDVARSRVLVALASRALGDAETAEMELDAARCIFDQLGAVPDLARVDELSARTAGRTAGGLTAREIEVLPLVAAGKTNRAIATDLVLSEKTVARHLSNIFTKLRLPSRAAATAYEHHLGQRPDEMP